MLVNCEYFFPKEGWLAINLRRERFFRGAGRVHIDELMCEKLGNSRSGRRLALEAGRCAGTVSRNLSLKIVPFGHFPTFVRSRFARF